MTNLSLELLVGTKNPHKAREIRRILGELPVEVLDLSKLKDIPDAPEEGCTLEENAIAKAHYFAKRTGLLTVSDDSGLEVDALGGRPGVYSARFAGENATDEDNNRLLLEKLGETPTAARTARFRCVIALASPEAVLFTCEGSVEGVITDAPSGDYGFGYDPLFFVPPFGGTFGRLGQDIKDRVSHRARALAVFKRRFAEYLSATG
ncbi:MAG: RdgB/HAM1 family non-canonical purine NTP pyrophosphatase [Planctomycetes bacterium]|nr:RdgB/HAM1 family non-canonical purine NTP pyrophosphatase [Planctomycetota bacterium]